MRQAKRLQHNSYTVGWICALPLEMAAAKAMLDERHEQLPQSSRDGNSYALGKIFGHNIVIACLPSGQYGTEAAATVSAQMWSTFPCIQLSLMVGVGGGVPTDIDIRLGDVVVSKPTGLYGGVFQYDQGKTMPNGRFKHTGALNRPPQKLLAAVADLQSDHMMGTSRIPEFFLEVKTRYPNMSDFLHPTGEDCLFQADYNHEHEGQSCDNCDRTKIIVRDPRPSRSPRIHYGLIASGSQVMKDASCRDHLAKEHGIICFEMEAAGVMNNSPCLVI
jgi:nucleoside phosphorylase